MEGGEKEREGGKDGGREKERRKRKRNKEMSSLSLPQDV
jgi:hypothetical protein